MRPQVRPQRDVYSPVAQNEIVYQATRTGLFSARFLVMLPIALAILSYAVVASAGYDGTITLLHYNDLDGKLACIYFARNEFSSASSAEPQRSSKRFTD